MRRAVVITFAVLVASLSGCAWQSERYGVARTDPFLWWLSGAPQPYELNWPRREVPDLPMLNPPEYTAVQPPRPLDVPRGWNPASPPYLGTGNEHDFRDPDAADGGCASRCDVPAHDPATTLLGVRAGARAGELARQR